MIRFLALAALVQSACNLGGTVGLDARADEPGAADSDAGDSALDVEGDVLRADRGPEGGSVVHIVYDIEVLSDRLYDLDGDGFEDNAVGDLGTQGDVLAGALTALGAAAADQGDRLVVHFPWLDDVVNPTAESAQLLVYGFRDADLPPDPTDDLSGEELVLVDGEFLDSCGAPLFGGGGLSVVDGVVSLTDFDMPLRLRSIEFPLENGRGASSIDPNGASSTLQLCGVAPVPRVGSQQGLGPGADATVLEELLAGGEAFGVPGLAGLTPDVDLDGDGLERFELDEGTGALVACVDGDHTVIPGRDCWSDPRIADGFSFCFRGRGMPGVFAGREPGWEYQARHGCDAPRTEEDVFGEVHRPELECAPLGEVCSPWSSTPCCDPSHLCSGAETTRYRCLERCDPSPCDYGAHPGACFSGVCVPLGFYAEHVVCDGSLAECETEYGATENTSCAFTGHRMACLEACDETAVECAGGPHCLPLVFEEGGVCGYRLGNGRPE